MYSNSDEIVLVPVPVYRAYGKFLETLYSTVCSGPRGARDKYFKNVQGAVNTNMDNGGRGEQNAIYF